MMNFTNDFEFTKTSEDFYISKDVRKSFDSNGFIIVRNLFSVKEIESVKNFVETDENIKKHAYGRSDGNNKISKMCLWNYAGDDLTGILTRSQKVSGTMQALLGGDEIYHYHSKLMMKEAKTGGSFVWHQDYGYWYDNGLLLPEMGSVFMPIDPCKKENGCLQVLQGSHKMGRINHGLTGEQAGVDPERLSWAKKYFPLIYVELNPGDVLFFHCNLLHSSAPNESEMRRWVLISSFNKKLNNPMKEHFCPSYHPLNILPNSAILAYKKGQKSTIDKEFHTPSYGK